MAENSILDGRAVWLFHSEVRADRPLPEKRKNHPALSDPFSRTTKNRWSRRAVRPWVRADRPFVTENRNEWCSEKPPQIAFGGVFGVRLPSGRLRDFSTVLMNLRTTLLDGDFRIWRNWKFGLEVFEFLARVSADLGRIDDSFGLISSAIYRGGWVEGNDGMYGQPCRLQVRYGLLKNGVGRHGCCRIVSWISGMSFGCKEGPIGPS